MLVSSIVSSSRRSKREIFSSNPTPPSGYNLDTVISNLRSGLDSSRWTDTSDPFAPSGLARETPPTINSTVNVSSLSELRAEVASGTGKRVILAPGTYTATGEVLFTLASTVADFELVFTGCTLNITGNFHSYIIHWNARRIRILNGTWNAIPEITGRDIYVYGGVYIGDNLTANPNANGSGLGMQGHRVVFEHVLMRGYNGIIFVSAVQEFDGVASIEGTTMTVNTSYTGAVGIGMSIIDGYSGQAVLQKTYITAHLGGNLWQVSRSQSRSNARIFAYSRPTNVIVANSIIEVPVSNTGATENPIRFNGVNQCLVVDSRLWGEQKPTMRNTCDYQHEWGSGLVGFVRIQSELAAGVLMSGGNAGVYPFTDTTIFDEVKLYREGSGGSTGIGIDYKATFNIVGFSGNGTTVTVTVFASSSQGRHNLTTGDTVVITQSGANAGLNGTYTITVTGDRTFTIANTVVGTWGGSQSDYFGYAGTDYDGNGMVIMRNCERFAATAEGTAGAGFTPIGYQAPSSTWTTCNNSTTALANGNALRTEVAAPAWAYREATPTFTPASAAEAPVINHDPLVSYGGEGQVTIGWSRPEYRVDGSAIGEIIGFRIYEDGVLIATLGDVVTTTQTGRSAGDHLYSVTCLAQSGPESDASYGINLEVTAAFSSTPLPSGSAGTTIGPWAEDAAAEGWLFYMDEDQQIFNDPLLYSYVYYISNPATLSLVLSGVQAGVWYGRLAPIQSGIVAELGEEIRVVTA